MKSKLLILLTVISIFCSGQSVPNTTTFSLQDVVNVTGGTTLFQAFTNSVDGYFDPAYKGAKDRLSNFRNYTVVAPASYYQYIVSHQTYANHYEACQGIGSTPDTIYSADFPLSVTSTLFTDPNLTYPYNSEASVVSFHPTGYRDDYFSVGSGATKSKVGESFVPSAKFVITKAQFFLRKVGSPTGSAVAKIYATTGADGEKICTGTALATSSSVDVSTLNPEDFTLVDFDFSGITLASGVCYAVVFEYSGGSGGNSVLLGIDFVGITHTSGNMTSQVNGDGTWYSDPYDAIFYVYGFESDQWRWAYLSSNPSITYAYWGTSLGNGLWDIIGCSEYSLTLDYDSFMPDYLEQSLYVNYTADSNPYTISVSDSAWMSITGGISSGSGNFAIHILGNSTDEPRTGYVYIKIGDSVVRTITVTQGY